MIEKMLAGSNKAVEAIEASQEKTDTGVQRATAAADTINQIADGINKIRDMNLQIATASQQQSSTSREISENIIKISTISEHSELAASKTNEHLQNLLSAADSLRDSIRKFQI